MDKITYRKMKAGEERQVLELVKAGFDEYVRSDVTKEGVKEFLRAAREMIYDKPATHFILVAESNNRIIGMIDMQENKHVCLFFIDSEFHRQGVGRCLLEQAIARCIDNAPNVLDISVNSSLFAVPVYKRLGFRQTKPEQILNGIRFVQMIKKA